MHFKIMFKIFYQLYIYLSVHLSYFSRKSGNVPMEIVASFNMRISNNLYLNFQLRMIVRPWNLTHPFGCHHTIMQPRCINNNSRLGETIFFIQCLILCMFESRKYCLWHSVCRFLRTECMVIRICCIFTRVFIHVTSHLKDFFSQTDMFNHSPTPRLNTNNLSP